jgi:hypothetical protein
MKILRSYNLKSLLINLIFLYFFLVITNFFLRDFISLFYHNFDFSEIFFFDIALLAILRIIFLSFSASVSSSSLEISELSILLRNSSLFDCRRSFSANIF